MAQATRCCFISEPNWKTEEQNSKSKKCTFKNIRKRRQNKADPLFSSHKVQMHFWLSVQPKFVQAWIVKNWCTYRYISYSSKQTWHPSQVTITEANIQPCSWADSYSSSKSFKNKSQEHWSVLQFEYPNKLFHQYSCGASNHSLKSKKEHLNSNNILQWLCSLIKKQELYVSQILQPPGICSDLGWGRDLSSFPSEQSA